MDFFTQSTDSVQLSQLSPVDQFADAIASRFGSGPLLTARLLPPSAPLMPQSVPQQESFPSLLSTNIDPWLDDPSALIIDIRSHAAHASARIPHALSLSVPSTLLKRPLFSLQRLSAMLPSPAARARFSAWRDASRILVYDADSVTIADSSNIHGLLRKFLSDGFHGQLVWLHGGFHAFWRDRRSLVDTHPPTPDTIDDDDDVPFSSSVLRTRMLPKAAFNLSSTTLHNSPHTQSHRSISLPHPHTLHPHPSPSLSSSTSLSAFNPFFDAIRQNVELSHGITERIPLRLPRRIRRRLHDLPFPWLRKIARRAAPTPVHHLSRTPFDSSSEDSEDDDAPDPADVEEGAEALAMQFYRIELAEQRRLLGIMDHHSKESGVANLTAHSDFPYSITAGIEKGAKNRYRHIWPFEHARVRLHQKRDTDDDYINASFVQPLGTNKRYIATQGPLPATFVDFWTLCWEQNVHVIVMLTRETEGAMVKCGTYWTDSAFGPLRLRLISTTGYNIPPAEPSPIGFFASSLASHPSTSMSARAGHTHAHRNTNHNTHTKNSSSPSSGPTIKRIFELQHTAYPEATPRRIVHLQYLDWPDMNVPDDPRGVLGLVREVESAVAETGGDGLLGTGDSHSHQPHSKSDIDPKTGLVAHARVSPRPVLLHCSAGVGRTGGFIVLDAVLDSIRREVRADMQGAVKSNARDAMDVDTNVDNKVISDEVAMTSPVKGTRDMHAQTSAVEQGIPWNSRWTGAPSEEQQSPEESSEQNNHSLSPLLAGSSSPGPPVSVPTSPPNKSSLPVAAQNALLHELPRRSTSSGSSFVSGDSLLHSPDRATLSSFATSLSAQSSLDKEVVVVSEPKEVRHIDFASACAAASTFNFTQTPHSVTAPELRLRTISAPSAAASGNNGPSRPFHLSLPGAVRAHVGLIREVVKVGRKEDSKKVISGKGNLNNRARNWLTPDRQSVASPGNLSVTSLALPSVTSDHEPPSRSQSPSADEASASGSHRGQSCDSSHVSQNDNASTSVPRQVSTLPPSQQSPTSPPVRSASPPPAKGHGFDYKQPRPLRFTVSSPPLALASLEDPIWEIVQDMREQRMSLCQSLRQYVFVHAVIIEGALMVVDEERERAWTTATAGGEGVPDTFPLSPFDSQHSGGKGYQSDASTTSVSTSASASINGKRSASPRVEGYFRGGREFQLHPKRPSVKRKHRSGDDVSRLPPFQRGRYTGVQVGASMGGDAQQQGGSGSGTVEGKLLAVGGRHFMPVGISGNANVSGGSSQHLSLLPQIQQDQQQQQNGMDDVQPTL